MAELDGLLKYVGMHINPEIADVFGLKILGVGAIVAGSASCSGRGKK